MNETPKTLMAWADAIQNGEVEPVLVVTENLRRCAAAWEAAIDEREEWERRWLMLLRTNTTDYGLIVDLKARIEELERGIAEAMLNLGVPQPGYPAPVAEAYRILATVLRGEEPRGSPWPGSRGALE